MDRCLDTLAWLQLVGSEFSAEAVVDCSPGDRERDASNIDAISGTGPRESYRLRNYVTETSGLKTKNNNKIQLILIKRHI